MSSPGKKTASLHESLPQGSRARSTLRENFHPRLVHGGPSSRGKRKTRRPFQEKAPLHLVLSSDRARGRWALSHRKNHARVQAMAYTFAARFKVKLHAVRVAGGRIHLLAKAAAGVADDLLTTLLLCAECPVLCAPAMNAAMWEKAAVQRNVARVADDGGIIVQPGTGWLSCRKQGTGRMAEPQEIMAVICETLAGRPPRSRS